MKTVLVICTANVCRSPMAAALLRHHIAGCGFADIIDVRSAGIWAYQGNPASSETAGVLAERGISLRDHRSQPVTEALLEEADLILVMEEAHRAALFYRAPQHLRKVHLWAELAGRHEDIEDPFGGPRSGYVRTAAHLEQSIESGFSRLLDLLGLPARSPVQAVI